MFADIRRRQLKAKTERTEGHRLGGTVGRKATDSAYATAATKKKKIELGAGSYETLYD
jgi:hypothetical protein